MKYRITLYIVLILAVGRLSAQTRYYSLSFSNIPHEVSGVAEEAIQGSFGLKVGTHKFKNNKVMRGFSLSYHSLSDFEEGSTYYSNDGYYTTHDVDLKFNTKIQKYTVAYEGIRLFGDKEFDDSWAIYGISGWYMAVNTSNLTVTSSDPNYHYVQPTEYQEYPAFDLGGKFGLGYQHTIGKQWMAFVDAHGYVSLVASAGYEWNIGVRYRGLGKH